MVTNITHTHTHTRTDRGMDMAAMILQMGREHGIPSYTQWRQECALTRPASWDDLRTITNDTELVEKLQKIYTYVYAGGYWCAVCCLLMV
jgi:hypothetical protein